MGEEPAGFGPRDGGGAVEPEFVAASAEGDALDRAAPATPPVTHNLTHTLCQMPLESTGRLHALRDLRVAQERPRSQPISVRRPGPERGRADQRGWTAVDTRGTSRTQSAESMRWVVTTNEEKQRTDTGGATRRKIAGHELGAPFHDQNTRGRSEKQSGDPGANAPGPPPARLPPRALRNDGLY